jgi:hypothetical protein
MSDETRSVFPETLAGRMRLVEAIDNCGISTIRINALLTDHGICGVHRAVTSTERASIAIVQGYMGDECRWIDAFFAIHQQHNAPKGSR